MHLLVELKNLRNRLTTHLTYVGGHGPKEEFVSGMLGSGGFLETSRAFMPLRRVEDQACPFVNIALRGGRNVSTASSGLKVIS